jgi:hypothetical protein
MEEGDLSMFHDRETLEAAPFEEHGKLMHEQPSER